MTARDEALTVARLARKALGPEEFRRRLDLAEARRISATTTVDADEIERILRDHP